MYPLAGLSIRMLFGLDFCSKKLDKDKDAIKNSVKMSI